jgi:undecaprenyl diphosphate synthase
MPDPDLLIRTAGEMRVSNFLLWQISYAELWVTDVCWPEFAEPHLDAAIASFASRERRFGGLSQT